MNRHHVPKKMLTQFQYSTIMIPTSFGHLHLELHWQCTQCFQEPQPSVWLWVLSYAEKTKQKCFCTCTYKLWNGVRAMWWLYCSFLSACCARQFLSGHSQTLPWEFLHPLLRCYNLSVMCLLRCLHSSTIMRKVLGNTTLTREFGLHRDPQDL